VGRVLTLARQLVGDGASAPGGGEIEEYDPLSVFQTKVTGGVLENRGIVAFETTFKEVAAAVRLEGLPFWSQAEPDRLIAGRRVTMKNYRFAMIFDDPATGQIVLARKLDPSPVLRGASTLESAVYEFLLMWPDAFATFLERVQDMERHQPALRRRRLGTGAQARVSGPHDRSSVLPDLSPSVPAAALNLPGEEDFGIPDVASSEIELRLGMSHDDLSLSGDLSAGLESGFDWGRSEPEPDPLSASPAPSPPAAAGAPEVDLGPADGWGLSDEGSEIDEIVAALPVEESDPNHRRSAAPPPPRPASVLGAVEADLAGRIRRLERGERADSGPSASPESAPSAPAAPEKLRVPRPDFHLMFRDYVYFWIGEPGGAESEIAIARRYRDVFFDLHRFACPGGGWGPDDAVQQFLRAKIRTNFVPQSLNYEALPEAAGDQHPLTVERLEGAFDEIT